MNREVSTTGSDPSISPIVRPPLVVYEEFFGAPVRTDRPAAALRAPRSLIDHPLRGGDEHLMRLALTVLAELDPGGRASTAERVQLLLQRRLCTTPPEIAVIARLSTMHPRTLQRRSPPRTPRSQRFWTTSVGDRRTRYLTTTEMPTRQIAHLVGSPTDPSSLAMRDAGGTPHHAKSAGASPLTSFGRSH
ncbi:hypothetical protein [Nocardia xishanensis]